MSLVALNYFMISRSSLIQTFFAALLIAALGGAPLSAAPVDSRISREPSSAQFCRELFQSKTIASRQLTALQDFVARDLEVVSSPEHASQVRIHYDRNGNPVKTAKVALIVHGLHQSPQWMNAQADLAFEKGYNVISLRLHGHFEKERAALDNARADDWIKQVFDARDLALDLGEQITLIGHSTGGLLTAYLVAKDPAAISDVIWLAPALHITKLKQSEAYLLSLMGISGWIKELGKQKPADGKYQSSWAGWQVISLSNRMRDLTQLVDRLHGKTLTIIDTAIDKVIDPKTNLKLAEAFQSQNGKVKYVLVNSNWNLDHSRITSPSGNLAYREIVEPALRDALSEKHE